MASRQTERSNLAPHEGKQEQWAQRIITQIGTCPQKLPWKRINLPPTECGGYQCEGLGHFISDALIAEGKGGIMSMEATTDPRCAWGPYYPDPGKLGKFDFWDLERKETYRTPDGWVVDGEPGDEMFWNREDGSVFRTRRNLDANALWYAIKYREEPE
ncbi:hypothetical protein IFR05_011097 [Cadophora sp. M221]|nr:hypothetical protein IFR05_011097 [Cadophora sp. M221]